MFSKVQNMLIELAVNFLPSQSDQEQQQCMQGDQCTTLPAALGTLELDVLVRSKRGIYSLLNVIV